MRWSKARWAVSLWFAKVKIWLNFSSALRTRKMHFGFDF
jgi:hypothetical protein